MKNIKTEILTYPFKLVKSYKNIHFFRNYFKFLDSLNIEYIAFIETEKQKDYRILLFKYCNSTKDYYRTLKFCEKFNMEILEWKDSLLLVIESKHININKNIIIKSRKFNT